MTEPRRHEAHEAGTQTAQFCPLSKAVVDCCFQVHRNLGPGLLEALYEEPACIEMQKKGLAFEAQRHIPVYYEGRRLQKSCRLDVLVEDKIILEIKAAEKIMPIHEAQILTYLKVSGLRIGFVMNFGDPYFKRAMRRFVL